MKTFLTVFFLLCLCIPTSLPAADIPALLQFLGGSKKDSVTAITLDPTGNIVITGVTESLDFMQSDAAIRAQQRGRLDIFLAKFTQGGQLIFSCVLGGSQDDDPTALGCDSLGNIYIGGITKSSDFSLQNVLGNPSQWDNRAFFLKIAPDGSSLLQSAVLGGNRDTYCYAIHVSPQGKVSAVGSTKASDFPVSPNAFGKINLKDFDGFYCRLSTGFDSLEYSTLLGAEDFDAINSIQLIGEKEVFLGGNTNSRGFPMNSSGAWDAFAAHFQNDTLQWCKSYGGKGFDISWTMGLSASGRLYLAGSTNSFDFPVIGQPLRPNYGGSNDGFIVELDTLSGKLLFSSFLGGNGNDAVSHCVLDKTGNIILAGTTSSRDFPVRGASPQKAVAGSSDIFVLRMGPDNRLQNSFLIGGSGMETNPYLALYKDSLLAVAGTTSSDSISIATIAKAMPKLKGEHDAFFAFYTLQDMSRTGPAFITNPTIINLEINRVPLLKDTLIRFANAGNYPLIIDTVYLSSGGTKGWTLPLSIGYTLLPIGGSTEILLRFYAPQFINSTDTLLIYSGNVLRRIPLNKFKVQGGLLSIQPLDFGLVAANTKSLAFSALLPQAAGIIRVDSIRYKNPQMQIIQPAFLPLSFSQPDSMSVIIQYTFAAGAELRDTLYIYTSEGLVLCPVKGRALSTPPEVIITTGYIPDTVSAGSIIHAPVILRNQSTGDIQCDWLRAYPGTAIINPLINFPTALRQMDSVKAGMLTILAASPGLLHLRVESNTNTGLISHSRVIRVVPEPPRFITFSVRFENVRQGEIRTARAICINKGAYSIALDSVRLSGLSFIRLSGFRPRILYPGDTASVDLTCDADQSGQLNGELDWYSGLNPRAKTLIYYSSAPDTIRYSGQVSALIGVKDINGRIGDTVLMQCKLYNPVFSIGRPELLKWKVRLRISNSLVAPLQGIRTYDPGLDAAALYEYSGTMAIGADTMTLFSIPAVLCLSISDTALISIDTVDLRDQSDGRFRAVLAKHIARAIANNTPGILRGNGQNAAMFISNDGSVITLNISGHISPAHVHICSAEGRVLYSAAIPDANSFVYAFPSAHLSAGVYYAYTVSAEGVLMQYFIVQ
jgi:hypothetical protein